MKWALIILLAFPLQAVAADWYIVGKTVECESHGQPYAWGDHHRAFGILQFHWPTFREMRTKSGMLWLHWDSPADQITLFKWALDNGYGNHWSCWRHHHREWERSRAGWIAKHRNNLLHKGT